MKNIKSTILIFTMLFASKIVDAQILVVNTFMPKMARYEDTWKASITNTHGAGFAYAELEITKNNSPYLKAVTEKFPLSNGITNLNFGMIKIENMILNSENVLWNQFLTFGVYEVCLRIYNGEQNENGEGCINVEILPVSPPVIISPTDESEICDNAIFTWAPPVPMNIFKNICYQLKIVPVYKGQSGYEAMSRNNPILNERCLTALSYIYNVSNLPLEDGLEYAWQVTSVDEGVEIGKSEVQTVKMCTHKEKPKEILIPDYYYKLRKTEDGNFGTAKGCLGFTCEDEPLDSNMKFKIFNNKGKELNCNDKLKLNVVGDGAYFILELISCNEFKVGQTYRLEVVAPSYKKYFIYFKYLEAETR